MFNGSAVSVSVVGVSVNVFASTPGYWSWCGAGTSSVCRRICLRCSEMSALRFSSACGSSAGEKSVGVGVSEAGLFTATAAVAGVWVLGEVVAVAVAVEVALSVALSLAGTSMGLSIGRWSTRAYAPDWRSWRSFSRAFRNEGESYASLAMAASSGSDWALIRVGGVPAACGASCGSSLIFRASCCVAGASSAARVVLAWLIDVAIIRSVLAFSWIALSISDFGLFLPFNFRDRPFTCRPVIIFYFFLPYFCFFDRCLHLGFFA